VGSSPTKPTIFKKEKKMKYTGVFQNQNGDHTFETKAASHDRRQAWDQIHDERTDKESCLVLLIDGDAVVRTFEDIVDIP
jgi:hypothetical protein